MAKEIDIKMSKSDYEKKQIEAMRKLGMNDEEIKELMAYDKDVNALAYKILSMSDRTFVNIIGVEGNEIDAAVFREYGELIRKVGKLDNTGVNNFRLGLSFNIGHDCPFFPFARATEGGVSFSIALELVEEINQLLNMGAGKSLNEIKRIIIDTISPQIDKIFSAAKEISERYGIKMGGFDFSLAPVISQDGSILAILRELGIFNFGTAGTMFATAYLTDVIKSFTDRYPCVGFSGVMYSLLEDLELCAVNNQRGVTAEQLISLSTMCGCGLDMVPIAADTKLEEISSLCMDVAAISCKYNKPLGVRLLSIPGTAKSVKSFTSISGEADFVSNTRLVNLNVNILDKECHNFLMRSKM